MKRNLTKNEYKKLYPHNNEFVMLRSEDLRAKLAKQINNFVKPAKFIVNIDITTFSYLQAILKSLSEFIMPWFSAELKNCGMSIRFIDMPFNNGKKTEYPTVTITNDIPYIIRNSSFRIAKVVSSNIMVSGATRTDSGSARVISYKDLDITVSKKPNFIAMATDADAPINQFPKDAPSVYWFPFHKEGEIDNPNSLFYKFCHSAPTLTLNKSFGQISIILGVMHSLLPIEYRDRIFEDMPDGSTTLHLTDKDFVNELSPYIMAALMRNVTRGIISSVPELDNLIDDEITLDEAGVEKLISLWRGESYKYIPSELIINDTIPMIGCAIKYKNKTYKIVTRVLDDDLNIVRAVDRADGSGSMVAYFELRYSNGYTISKDISYTDDKEGLAIPDIGIDEEDSNKILKAWYGIQLSLMHPIIRVAIEDQSSRDTTVVAESTKPKTSKKKEIERHIRHYYNITGDMLAKVLNGNCRHNQRHTMSWYVIGHWRTYKDGHQTFIKGHWRGPLRSMYSRGDHRKRDIDM